jgi:hypothetical protein
MKLKCYIFPGEKERQEQRNSETFNHGIRKFAMKREVLIKVSGGSGE